MFEKKYKVENLGVYEIKQVKNVVQHKDKNGNLTYSYDEVKGSNQLYICQGVGDHIVLFDNNGLSLSQQGLTYANNMIFKVNKFVCYLNCVNEPTVTDLHITKKHLTKSEIFALENKLNHRDIKEEGMICEC